LIHQLFELDADYADLIFPAALTPGAPGSPELQRLRPVLIP
jgi:hypothetical protein